MNLFKKLPLAFQGELHDVKLINFTIDPKELDGQLPTGIKPRLFDGRAMISMVNVQLRHMRPALIPQALHFAYKHMAFRLLVDDTDFGNDPHHGLYFLRSFTDAKWAVTTGNLLTHYRLEQAQIDDQDYLLELRQGDQFLHYAYSDNMPEGADPKIRTVIGKLDRAYAANGEELFVTQILRKHWPLEWIECYHFETNFFKTAQVAGAFRIHEPIEYHWMAPTRVYPVQETQLQAAPKWV